MDEVFTRETALGLAMKFMNRSGRHSTDRGLSKPGKPGEPQNGFTVVPPNLQRSGFPTRTTEDKVGN